MKFATKLEWEILSNYNGNMTVGVFIKNKINDNWKLCHVFAYKE